VEPQAVKIQPLPPLNSLHAFESAARHLSFTLAAKELNVTQGAISRQVAQPGRKKNEGEIPFFI
jgi:hypothetical protein